MNMAQEFKFENHSTIWCLEESVLGSWLVRFPTMQRSNEKSYHHVAAVVIVVIIIIIIIIIVNYPSSHVQMIAVAVGHAMGKSSPILFCVGDSPNTTNNSHTAHHDPPNAYIYMHIYLFM